MSSTAADDQLDSPYAIFDFAVTPKVLSQP